jgi:hypothetical protein
VNELPTVYAAGWVADGVVGLPAASQELLARETIRERKDAEEAEASRAEALENVEFVAAREGRDVTLAGVFARAERGARKTDREGEQASLAARIESGELVVLDRPPVSRSDGWPGSEFEVDRIARQAMDGRSWMAGYLMRLASRRGHAAAHIEASRSEAEARHLQRSQPASVLTARSEPYSQYFGPEISRVVAGGRNAAWPG